MISGATKILAVLGAPVTHSLSPQMHNAWLAEAGIDAVYAALPIGPGAFAGLRDMGLFGVNVTVPFKERAAAIATDLDETAARLGAANVLAFRGGPVAGYNTDARGFIASLDEDAPGWRARVDAAVVLGAGGAARAIAWGLAAAGVGEILIANRTSARADDVAQLHPAMAPWPWERIDAAFARADLIVNATSLGLAGAASPAWPLHAAPAHAIVADAVYRPLETPLLAAARARGLAVVDGLGMLIHQGAAAFSIWFDVAPDVSRARGRLLAALDVQNRAAKSGEGR